MKHFLLYTEKYELLIPIEKIKDLHYDKQRKFICFNYNELFYIYDCLDSENILKQILNFYNENNKSLFNFICNNLVLKHKPLLSEDPGSTIAYESEIKILNNSVKTGIENEGYFLCGDILKILPFKSHSLSKFDFNKDVYWFFDQIIVNNSNKITLKYSDENTLENYSFILGENFNGRDNIINKIKEDILYLREDYSKKTKNVNLIFYNSERLIDFFNKLSKKTKMNVFLDRSQTYLLKTIQNINQNIIEENNFDLISQKELIDILLEALPNEIKAFEDKYNYEKLIKDEYNSLIKELIVYKKIIEN